MHGNMQRQHLNLPLKRVTWFYSINPSMRRAQEQFLPQCDGPYTIVRLPTVHTAILEDSLSGEPLTGGRAVTVTRLVKFSFPQQWSGPESAELARGEGLVESLRPSDLIAVGVNTYQKSRVHVARVERTFPHQGQVEVVLYHVPKGEWFGPW